MAESEAWVKIEREFDAPIDLVWKMWTDPKLFSQWYGPNGMTIPVTEMDLKIGGIRKICMEMRSPDRTMSMRFTGVFKEITPTSRLVYTESMCDPNGTLISPKDMGMPDGTPDVTEVIVELSDVDGKTLMTMQHIGVPEGSAGQGGWEQAFGKLADAIADSV